MEDIRLVNNFARIGKKVLIKALGPQKNYKEEYIQSTKLDEEASGCLQCPLFKEKQNYALLDTYISDEIERSVCKCKCDNAKYTNNYNIVYINEKNKYGLNGLEYELTLKLYALKLFLVYHFFDPDKIGFIKEIDTQYLAEMLNCDIKTIHNNNNYLQKYGYIFFGKSGWNDKNITVCLPEYKNYHLTAKEGGRGYLTMSKDILEQLLSIDNINELRLCLRGLLEVDDKHIHNQNPEFTKSYKELNRYLPKYCKRNVIKKALSNKPISNIFQLSISKEKVNFKIEENFNFNEMREKEKADKKQYFTKYIENLNSIFKLSNDSSEEINITSSVLHNLRINKSKKYPEILLKTNDLDGIADLCIRYPVTYVTESIIFVYNNYILKGEDINCFPALLRTYIKNSFSKAS